MTAYQVTAECAHVTVTEVGGVPAMKLLYKGAPVPDGVDPARIQHLLDNHLISAVDGEPIAPNASVSQEPAADKAGTSESNVSARVAEVVLEQGSVAQAAETPAGDGEADAKRAEARAKLAEVGGVPDGRSSDAVMVEYLVKNGYDRAEVERADRAGLKSLVATVK